MTKGKSKNFYLIILDSIRDTSSIKGVVKNHIVSKQLINYYVSQLKRRGVIRRIGYGVWALNGNYDILKRQVKKFSVGTKAEKPTTNLHALNINFPIISGTVKDYDWQIKEKLNNWIPKYKGLNILGGLTIKNNNGKSITVFARTRDIDKLEDIDTLAIKIRSYVCEYFRNQGVILDYFNTETKNMHIATEDTKSESMLRKGEKIELNLNKKAEKIFPKDDIDAKAWIDGSPFQFTAETNDKEWKRWYLSMPVFIKDQFGLLNTITNNMVIMNDKINYIAENYASHTGMVEEGLNVFKSLNKKLSQKKIMDFK
jgi:hypothetical protein